ncbi:MAG: CPBP family intramembrane metalloprotease [Chloroflexi bacterium]|nr:CPBP family intramembrane metalloprotease [Chloroflexota bacterium]
MSPAQPGEPAADTYSSVPWNAGDLVKAVLLILAGLFLAVLLLGGVRVFAASPGDSILWTLFLSALLEGLLLAAVARFALWKHRVSWSALGFHRPRGRRILLVSLATVVLGLLTTGLYSLLIRILGLSALQPPPLPSPPLDDILAKSFFALTVIGIAPVAEETFFRGFAFPALRKRWGTPIGVAGSSLLFGLAHGEVGLFIPLSLLGVFLALLYLSADSLWAPILSHFGFNALALGLGNWP